MSRTRITAQAETGSKTQSTTHLDEELKAIFSNDRLWVTIVWDDPVNLMSYVTYVFMELFGYTKEHATELMLKVHNDGKAVVSNGSREEMERDVQRLHEYGLWATISKEEL
jgi:ATP-dependent Clp protease adaptor protein ClpS